MKWLHATTNLLLLKSFLLLIVFVFGGIILSSQVGAQPIPVEDTIGVIDTPPGVTEQIAKSGLSTDEIAIFYFLTTLITIFNVLAGIWVMFNIVFAAFIYLSGQGSSDTHKKVRDKITMSVVGLFLLAIAYAAVAILSLLLFGDAGYVLNPTLP